MACHLGIHVHITYYITYKQLCKHLLSTVKKKQSVTLTLLEYNVARPAFCTELSWADLSRDDRITITVPRVHMAASPKTTRQQQW